MSNYPAGVTYLPGERPEEVAYQRAYEDWHGYMDTLRAEVADSLRRNGVTSVDADAIVGVVSEHGLHALAFILDIPLPSRDDYAAEMAEKFLSDHDERDEEPYE